MLQAHVDEGLKLARRHRLPQPIADFIPEHQGTLKMGYFLHKAQERGGAVEERRFRYRGPEPRSKETAILMLADGCEAALRSLPPTPPMPRRWTRCGGLWKRGSGMDNCAKAASTAAKWNW